MLWEAQSISSSTSTSMKARAPDRMTHFKMPLERDADGKYTCIYSSCRQRVGGPNLHNIWQHILKHQRTNNYGTLQAACVSLPSRCY
jgi:hypothetical protein